MATFIRIKRRLCDEPLESIVVRPKRMRVEGGGAGGEAEEGGGGGGGGEGGGDVASPPPLPPPTLLERVGTVESKDTKIDASLLREYKKGWELRQTYKRLGGAEGGWREAGRKMAKERERESREMITNKHRGNITDTNADTNKREADKHTKTTTEEEEEEEEEGNKKKKTKKTEGKEEEEEEEKKKKEEEEEEAVVQFYDAKISFNSLLMEGVNEVITCNGKPMETEKYVYDIYYYPRDTNWGNCVFEEPNLTMEVKDEGDEDDTDADDDDENAEDNWRNDYPEDEDEDEDEYAEEYDYFDRPTRRRNLLDYDTDESFDADEYKESDEDDCGFDEDGNLITVASLGDRLKVTTLGSGDESD